MSLYDSNKLMQHADVLAVIAEGRGAALAPVHVRIEPTEACNFRCRFCWAQDPERLAQLRSFSDYDATGQRRFELNRLLTLIEELAEMGTKAISFVAVGDPLVYPGIAKVIARAQDLGLATAVTSNLAMKMDDELIRVLAACAWVRWSMNAGSEDVYVNTNKPRQAHPEQAYERVKSNVARLVEARGASGSKMQLNASYVVSEWNETDVAPAAALAKALGIDGISFRPDMGHQRQDVPSDANRRNHERLEATRREYSDATFTVHVEDGREEEVVRVSADQDVSCFYSNHSIYIAANGDVYPCCYTRSDRKYVMGNIATQSFAQFWNTPERLKNHLDLNISSCPSCPYFDINKQLRGLYEHTVPVDAVRVTRDQPDPFV